MKYPKKCPHCEEHLDIGDIYDCLKKKHPQESDEKIREWAGNFGWSESNRVRFSNIVAVINPISDRMSHYQCPKCLSEIKVRPQPTKGLRRSPIKIQE